MNNSVFIGKFEEEVNNDSSNEKDEGDENSKEELDFKIISKISPSLNM